MSSIPLIMTETRKIGTTMDIQGVKKKSTELVTGMERNIPVLGTMSVLVRFSGMMTIESTLGIILGMVADLSKRSG